MGERKGGDLLDRRFSVIFSESRHKSDVGLKLALALAMCLIIALAGCSGCSRGAEVLATPSRPAPEGLCGLSDDGLAHVPPRFNDFVPPRRGDSYIDQQYGCAIVRLTDAKSQFKLAVHHQYSTITAVNQDDTLVMLLTEWGQGLVVDMAGNLVVAAKDFPAINTGNVPWARHPSEAFYYTNGNTLYRGLISGHIVKSTVLHVFGSYPTVVIPDQEDLSDDGDHLWMVGGQQAFLYTISTGAIGPVVNIGPRDVACGWHKIQISSSNKMVITWSCNGAAAGRGQEVYAADGTPYWHMFDNSLHTDVGTDLSGNEVAVVGRIPDTYKDACPSGGGADVIRFDPPHLVSCLVDLNWAPSHISYRDSSEGWVAISLFDQGTCPHYSCFAPQDLEPDWQSDLRTVRSKTRLCRCPTTMGWSLSAAQQPPYALQNRPCHEGKSRRNCRGKTRKLTYCSAWPLLLWTF
jgi:hypothetical protein